MNPWDFSIWALNLTPNPKVNRIRNYKTETNLLPLRTSPLDSGILNPWVNHSSLAHHGYAERKSNRNEEVHHEHEKHEEREEQLREFENFYFDPPNDKNVNE